MNARNVDRATFAWALDERVRLQGIADDLWDALDDLQPLEDMQRIWAEYDAVCDQIDLLEKSPECAKNGHEYVERIDLVSGRDYDLICDRCGQISHLRF